jgi:hypothetical protein
VGEKPASWEHARWISGAQIAGVWRLPFGALEAGYGYASTGSSRFDISIGRAF